MQAKIISKEKLTTLLRQKGITVNPIYNLLRVGKVISIYNSAQQDTVKAVIKGFTHSNVGNKDFFKILTEEYYDFSLRDYNIIPNTYNKHKITLAPIEENELETRLYHFIKELYTDIKAIHPEDGLSSPRDIEIAKEINRKCTIMDHMQDAMRVINPSFEIRDK